MYDPGHIVGLGVRCVGRLSDVGEGVGVETLRRFRLLAVRLSLLLTGAAALPCLLFDGDIAMGVLLGGIAGTLVFWLKARSLAKVAFGTGGKVTSVVFRWTTFGWVIYGLVLWKAYTLNRASWCPIIAAALGLCIVRGVIVILGVTGWDLTPEERNPVGTETDGEHR
jgi:hypothetical protein